MAHHRRGLRRLLRDDELLDRIEADWRAAGLAAKRVAMLEYAEKLTRAPASVRQDDVQRLRNEGFADEDILAICEVVGYYAFVNRMADGLGVPLESDAPPPGRA